MKKNKKRVVSTPKVQPTEGHSMQDLIGEDMFQQLKKQAKQLEEVEQQRQEEKRQEILAAKQAEKKKMENDFAYLLENSDPNWNKYK